MRLSLSAIPVPAFLIRLRSGLSREFFSVITAHLQRLLRKTRARPTLRIETLHEQELPYLQRLLYDLARIGHRVCIVPGAQARRLVRVDSSVFRLVLDGEA
jgi:hypothetical protein